VAFDPESRLVLAVVPGARNVEAVEEVVDELKQRTDRNVLKLVTSDAYPAYETALLRAFGEELTTTATGRASRKKVSEKAPPPGLNYATVEKRREKGRVVEIVTRVVFDDGGGAGGVVEVECGPTDQHIVPRTPERHRPAPQRLEGAEDLHIQ